MAEVKILNQNEIQDPRTPYPIESGRTDKDWEQGLELGSSVPDTVLCPDKNWVPYNTEYELQRNALFDSFSCVTQSAWNKVQCLAKRLFAVVLNESKRRTAVKSGTRPGQGNSVTNVVESIRKDGGVPEEVWPTITPSMTQGEFYSPIPPEVDAKENFLKEYDYNHKWLPTNYLGATMEKIVDNGLLYSPVMVSIEGSYTFDEEGKLQYAGGQYTHEVLVVASRPSDFLVLDSENPQGLMRVRRDYAFVGPKIGYLKKKSMFRLIKTASLPNVFLLCVASGDRYGVADGDEVTGGDLLKSFSGTYANADISVISDEEMASYTYVGDIAARKL